MKHPNPRKTITMMEFRSGKILDEIAEIWKVEPYRVIALTKYGKATGLVMLSPKYWDMLSGITDCYEELKKWR